MKKIYPKTNPGHINELINGSVYSAISEILWNSLDADANNIKIDLLKNPFGGIQEIIISDDGEGIDYSNIDKLFGDLGDSWKKEKKLTKSGRSLHGSKNSGRFKTFVIGNKSEWETFYYEEGQELKKFKIIGDRNSDPIFVATTSVTENSGKGKTGTILHIKSLCESTNKIQNKKLQHEVAKNFAPTIKKYPSIKISIDGQELSIKSVEKSSSDYELSSIDYEDISHQIKLTIIEWNIPVERTINLCDENGITLAEIPIPKSVRAPGYNFTAYLKSTAFRKLHEAGSLDLIELDNNLRISISNCIYKIKDHFRNRIVQENSEIIDKWRKENIYPYSTYENSDPVTEVERQVFDIIAVNVESHLPSFEKLDLKSKKFTFRLLSQALKQNPESLEIIINEVLDLKKEDQDNLAHLIRKCSFSSIIKSAKIISNRLDFLNSLEKIIFDKEYKEKLLERDQLHKILEKETWIFDEEFSLSLSEQRLEEVLEKHISKLGNRQEKSKQKVLLSDGRQGRVDLMFQKANQPRSGEYDYLIVELKRPNQKINDQVITQITKYAIAVANDERFNAIPAKWKFIAVSNEFDDFAQKKANQRNQPKGLVYEDGERNITVWIKEWSDIINQSRSKLLFINKFLKYEADNESSMNYLREVHEKYIPIIKD